MALAVLVFPAFTDAKPKKLPYGEAVLQARLVMADWSLDRGLRYPDDVRCVRKSRVRFRCSGFASKDEERFTRRCDLVAIVTNRYRRLNYSGYWEAVAKLTGTRCRSVAKPYLTEPAAIAAIESAGVTELGHPVTVGYLFRASDTELVGAVEWNRPPEICSADVTATRLPDGTVRVEFTGAFCF